MPLESQDHINSEVLKNIIRNDFADLENPDELSKSMLAFLDEHQLCLDAFTGEWHTMIVRCIGKAIIDKKYDTKLAQVMFKQILLGVDNLNKKQRYAYANQPRESSMIEDLKNKKYVKARRLTHTEIKQMFDFYLGDIQKVNYSHPISLTSDEGRLISETLEKRDPAKKLLIPVNIGNNHYVLFIKDPKQGHLVCWDPVSEKESPVKEKKPLGLLNQISNKLGLKIQYEFASEQCDPISCGYRITQKAFKEAGLDHELVKIPVDDTTSLCTTFIKQLAKTDRTLQSEKLEITEGETPLVFLSSAVQTSGVSEVIKNQKKAQMEKDERLAIVLQHIYNTDSQISSEILALQSAKQALMKLSPEDFVKLQHSIINWAKTQALSWTKQLHDSKKTSKTDPYQIYRQKAWANQNKKEIDFKEHSTESVLSPQG